MSSIKIELFDIRIRSDLFWEESSVNICLCLNFGSLGNPDRLKPLKNAKIRLVYHHSPQ